MASFFGTPQSAESAHKSGAPGCREESAWEEALKKARGLGETITRDLREWLGEWIP